MQIKKKFLTLNFTIDIQANHQTVFPNYHSGHRAPSKDFKLVRKFRERKVVT